MPGPAFLASDRVTLRTVAEEDHRLFERAHNEPAFRDGLLFRTPQTPDDVAAFVEDGNADDDVLLVVCVDGGDGVAAADDADGGDDAAADDGTGDAVDSDAHDAVDRGAGVGDAHAHPVGAVSLSDVTREHATLAYWLVPEARGEGYATDAAALLVDYAFDTLCLHHVVAWTVAGNDASQAVLERLGFTEEGRLREHVFWDGAHRDAVYFGLLADEWESE